MPGSVHEAILLGALQGLTELLPLSSDGHLLLAHLLVHSRSPDPGPLALMHVGTLGATLLALRGRLPAVGYAALLALRHPRVLSDTVQGRDARFLALATLPTVAIGLVGFRAAAALASSPLVVAFGLLITGALLVSTFRMGTGHADDPSAWQALAIGTAQGLAVFPGLSRTAATVVVALWLGLRVTRAYELSLLASLPAVVGVLAVASGEIAATVVAAPAASALSCLAAFVVGVVALRALRSALVAGLFPWFSVWVVPLGLSTLALAWAWPARTAAAAPERAAGAASTSNRPGFSRSTHPAPAEAPRVPAAAGPGTG